MSQELKRLLSIFYSCRVQSRGQDHVRVSCLNIFLRGFISWACACWDVRTACGVESSMVLSRVVSAAWSRMLWCRFGIVHEMSTPSAASLQRSASPLSKLERGAKLIAKQIVGAYQAEEHTRHATYPMTTDAFVCSPSSAENGISPWCIPAFHVYISAHILASLNPPPPQGQAPWSNHHRKHHDPPPTHPQYGRLVDLPISL